MQRNRLFYLFCDRRGMFSFRRANNIVTAVRLQLSHGTWNIAKRRCGVVREETAPQSMKGTGITTLTSPSSSPPGSLDDGNGGWDDNTLIEDIGRVLFSQLSSGKEIRQSKTEEMISVHTLFRTLGPSLRLQLQNSSFGALVKLIKSKSDWFVLNQDGSKVGLTEVALSHLGKNMNSSLFNAIGSGRGNDTIDSRKAPVLISKSRVLVYGVFGSTPIDISRPPLTSEEVEKWKLTRLLLPLALHFIIDREPRTFYPHAEKPRRLSPELEEAEALYVSKGLFPPSEVAAAFVHITPTFFVETRYVLGAMSPDIAQCIERHFPKDRVVDAFFKKYPMIFKLKTGKFQKAVLKLNLDFDFIRNYPGCGRADRTLRRYNQEYKATVGGVVAPVLSLPSKEADIYKKRVEPHIDVKIFEILVRNLPRFPTDPTLPKEELENKRYQPFSLVEWIDTFSEEDLNVLNSVPQQRVLTLMSRYSHVFQMVCRGEDANLFAEHMYLKVVKNFNAAQLLQQDLGCQSPITPSTLERVDNSCDLPIANITLLDEGGMEESAEKSSAQLDEDIKRREATLAAALRDDLINLDDILCGNTETQATVGENKESRDLDEGGDETQLAEINQEEDFFNCNEEEEEEKNKNISWSEKGVDGVRKKSPHDVDQTSADDDMEGPYIPSRYDIIYVRRLPKGIAPRSLSDYNAINTPEPELMRHIASFLNPPPSIRDKAKSGTQYAKKLQLADCFVKATASGPWRWVPIQRIYASLSGEQKRLLRPYKGLVHFMRLHGEVFELSADFLHVIAHDPEGQVPPFLPTQTVFRSEERVLLPPTFDDDEDSRASLIGDTERNKFESILGASQIPTDRRQLLLLDPLNPLLSHEVLCEEVSFFMPDHPVSLHQLMARLPPILKAALSTRHKNNFKTSKYLTVWTENNRMMLQKSHLALPESVLMEEETLTIEEAIECVREMVPDEGVMIGHLNRMIPSVAKKTFKEHFGNLYNALLGYPQYFYIDKVEGSRSNSTLFLVERLQEKD